MEKDYEQMEIDLTLENDRSLKDNVQNVAKFALGQIMRYDSPSAVRNRHEGYGIAAEYYVYLRRNVKTIEADMKSMLALLPNDEGNFINICGSLYNSAVEIAVSAIKLAAQSQRILENLYDSETWTPMEEYLDKPAGEDGSSFEDAGPSGEGSDEAEADAEFMEDEEDL